MSEIFAIKDIKSNVFHNPFVMQNKVEAERGFREAISGKHGVSIITQYPSEFDLFLIGEYNEETGEMKNKEKELIISGAHIKYWEDDKERKKRNGKDNSEK